MVPAANVRSTRITPIRGVQLVKLAETYAKKHFETGLNRATLKHGITDTRR